MPDIKLRQIGADEPNWLKRMAQSARYRTVFTDGTFTEADVDGLADFLLDYVVEPADRDEARVLLLSASQTQIVQIINGISAGAEDPFDVSEPRQSNSGV